MGRMTSAFDQLGNGYKSIDLYSQTVNFNIKGKQSHKSFIGAFVSTFVVLLVFFYGLDKFKIMLDRSDTNYTEVHNINEDVESSQREFTFEETNFDVAFGLTSGSLGISEEEMSGYAEWFVQHRAIDPVTGNQEYQSLSYHVCTQDDYDKYFKVENIPSIQTYGNLLCLDHPEDIKLKGSTDSLDTELATLSITLTRCQWKEECRESWEIDAFLNYMKPTYFLNTEQYNLNEFDDPD